MLGFMRAGVSARGTEERLFARQAILVYAACAVSRHSK